ncbi:MAG TPA: hypothetical protein VFU45_01880 [Gemmatimonadales bacterium]|nr:hypothetical protein [Gemmatimonadales bacterium]
MVILGAVLLAVLIIPVLAILFESPLGRAFARRVAGPEPVTGTLAELAKKVELLEGEVDDLHRAVELLQEENQFLQRLVEDAPRPPTLPPGPRD